MRNQNYFAFAVMIAIIIPIAIGGIYFLDMYNKRGEKSYLSEVTDKDEVLVLGDIGLDNSLKNNTSEFLVKFTYGLNSIRKYHLVLDDINFPDDMSLEDIKWKLLMYDEETKSYLGLKSGSFEDLENSKLIISPSIYIKLDESQKFRFSFYSETQNREFDKYIKGNLKVELE